MAKTQQKEIYPKVAAKGKVKACNKKKGCTDLKFDDLNFTGSQFELICDWVDAGIEVTVTIQQIEGMLVDCKASGKQMTMATAVAEGAAAHDKADPKNKKQRKIKDLQKGV